MTHAAIRLATVLGLSVVVGSGLSAQRGDGAWFGYGLGLSVAHQSRNVPVVNSLTQYTRASTTVGGIQAYMKLGATPSQFVRVGAALQGWAQFSSPSAGAETIASITASLYYFPLGVRSGFFLTGGVGESQLHSSVNNCFTSPEETECTTALDNRSARTIVIGMGYAPVRRRVSFAPKVAYLRQAFGTCSAFCPDYLVEFGLDVTYH